MPCPTRCASGSSRRRTPASPGTASPRRPSRTSPARPGCPGATVYRYFPGGRDQLIGDVVTWEVGRFFARLPTRSPAPPTSRTLLEEALVFAHRAVEEHEVLQKVLADRARPAAAAADGRRQPGARRSSRAFADAVPGARAAAAGRRRRRRPPTTWPAWSCPTSATQGRWDLTDRAQVDAWSAPQFLAGVRDG